MKRIREKRIEKGWTQLDLARNQVFHNQLFHKLKMDIESIRPIQILRK